MILIDKETGQEWETMAHTNYVDQGGYWYPRLGKVPKRHTFGGVVFEETGEVEYPGTDGRHWALNHDNYPQYYPSETWPHKRIILRAVEIIND